MRAMEELRIQSGGYTLAASYSPAGGAAIVALHGARGGTRDTPLFNHLHTLLPPAGIGVVTFDRRGEGESTGDSTRGRFTLQAEDALAVIDAIGAQRVGLWGYSQGGWIGPGRLDRSAGRDCVRRGRVSCPNRLDRCHALRADDVRGRAPARPRRLRGRRGRPRPRAAARVRAWVRGGDPEQGERLAAELREAVDEPWWSHVWLPPTLLDEESRRLWIDEMDFDPRPIFARVRAPTLLFYGEADSWTPVEPSVQAWRAARGDEVEVVVISQAEHDMTLPGGNISPDYERTLVQWLVERALRSRR